jgi:protein-tyrosine phosphatase
MTRHLELEEAVNVRDMGGVRVRSGPLAAGVLVRSASLSQLTDEGWAALYDHGVRTVVDLRAESEVERAPVRPEYGIEYRHVPILDVVPGAGDEVDHALPDWHAAYPLIVDRFRSGFAAAIAAIADAAPGGVAVHCRVGRDRTGIVVALLLSLAGASREEILEDYALSAELLAATFEEWIAGAPDERTRGRLEWESAAPSDLILSALDHLDERYGGVEPYLAGAGVDVDRVRKRLGGDV